MLHSVLLMLIVFNAFIYLFDPPFMFNISHDICILRALFPFEKVK